MSATVIAIAMLLYNMTLIVGVTYLVVNYNWSMWTYLLAICFLTNFTNKKV